MVTLKNSGECQWEEITQNQGKTTKMIKEIPPSFAKDLEQQLFLQVKVEWNIFQVTWYRIFRPSQEY